MWAAYVPHDYDCSKHGGLVMSNSVTATQDSNASPFHLYCKDGYRLQ